MKFFNLSGWKDCSAFALCFDVYVCVCVKGEVCATVRVRDVISGSIIFVCLFIEPSGVRSCKKDPPLFSPSLLSLG